MAKKPFYITTTLPYVNSDPHIGFAMEIIRADAIVRYKKAAGFDVFFNTGTDEHGVKIYQKAFESGEDIQKFVDRYVEKFKALRDLLGLSEDMHFVRTTDPHHLSAAAEFWKRCDAAGYIYKKNYKAKYCPGCELERTDTEIVNGRCFIHQTIDLIIIEEENYFFKFSAFQKQLLEIYAKFPDFVVPTVRLNEIRAFVERGLEDFSISRLSSKMPWGIAVPGDPAHVMYVWFDALVNYISTLGWPEDEADFQKYWQEGTPVQYCGKDNLRQQAAMWQAMLMAAGLPNSRQIVIDGFVTGEGGIKMSKSIGNVVDPTEIVQEYGVEALRYFVTKELHPFEDSPFTPEAFKEAYNAHLANGLGNLVSRVMKMAAGNNVQADNAAKAKISALPQVDAARASYRSGFDGYNLQMAMNAVWELVAAADALVQERQPFKKIKTDKEGAISDIRELLAYLGIIAEMISPIMPTTAATISSLLSDCKMPDMPLFARK